MSLLAQLFNKNGDKIDPINHNYEIILRNLNNRIQTLENKNKILYNNDSGVTGNVIFDGDYRDYDYIFITTERGTGILYPSKQSSINISETVYADVLYQYYDSIAFSYNSQTGKSNVRHLYQGGYYSGSNHSSNLKIFRIIGINLS